MSASRKYEHVASKRRTVNLRKGGTLARFFGTQALAQVVALIVGLIVVNQLTKEEYSYYTIVVAVTSAITVLGSSGFGAVLLSNGAQLREDPTFSSFIVSVLSLRRKLFFRVACGAVPILGFLLLRNDASIWNITALTCLALLTCATMTSTTVFNDLLALEYQRSRLQYISLVASGLRLLGAGSLFLIPLKYAVIPVAVNSAVTFITLRMQRKTASNLVNFRAAVTARYKKMAMMGYTKLLPVNLFAIFQGQVIVFILSLQGLTNALAEVGALSRFPVAFVVLTSTIASLAGPIVARASADRLKRTYGQAVAGSCFLIVCLVGLVYLASPWLVLLLGSEYSGLKDELMVMFVAGAVFCLGDVLRILNQARGWIDLSWMQIPLSLLAIACGLLWIDLDTSMGGCLLMLTISFPQLVTQLVLLVRGIRSPCSIDLENLRQSASVDRRHAEERTD